METKNQCGHHNLPFMARGMCRPCYAKWRRQNPEDLERKKEQKVRQITCGHEDRLHEARGMCRKCYNKWHWINIGKPEPPKRVCSVCLEGFKHPDPNAEYCSTPCRKLGDIIYRRKRRSGRHLQAEQIFASRDKEWSKEVALMAKERGCRRVSKFASPKRLRDPDKGYFAAWYRSGGLYVVRVRWPEEPKCEENLEEAAE